MTEILTKETVDDFAKFAGLRIKKPSEQKTVGVCGAIYGQGGAGKTSLVSDLYKLGKTLHIDIESGTDVLEHLGDNPDYDILEVSNYQQFQKIVDALKRDHSEYINIIVDNLSELLDQCEDFMGIKGNDAHDLQRYKLVKMEMLRRVKDLRELSRKYGLNVFFLCWDADEKDDRNVLKKDLALTPALRKEFPGLINLIAHIRVLRDPNTRMLDFAPGPKTVAKFRRAPNSSAMQVPFQIVYTADKMPLVDVIKTIKEGVKWDIDKYKTKATDQDE